MFWYILTAILFLVFLAGVGTAMLSAISETKASGVAVAIGSVVIWAIVSVFFVWNTVDAGHVGLVKRFGDYTAEKGPGLAITMPWETIEQLKVRNDTHTIRMDGQEGRGAAGSKESQNVYVLAKVNYSFDPRCAREIVAGFGTDFYDNVIEPRFKQVFKAHSVQYGSIDILPKREEIRREVQTDLRDQLNETFTAEETDECVIALDVILEDVSFDEQFENAIVEKQTATQQALAEQNKVAIAQRKGEQRITTAEADAKATRINADATAYANRQQRQTLTPLLVEMERVKTWKPTIVYVPTDANIFVNPNAAAAAAGE